MEAPRSPADFPLNVYTRIFFCGFFLIWLYHQMQCRDVYLSNDSCSECFFFGHDAHKNWKYSHFLLGMLYSTHIFIFLLWCLCFHLCILKPLHAPVYELAQSFATTKNILSLYSPRLWVLRKSVTSGSVQEDIDHCYFPRKQYLSSKSMDKVSKWNTTTACVCMVSVYLWFQSCWMQLQMIPQTLLHCDED